MSRRVRAVKSVNSTSNLTECGEIVVVVTTGPPRGNAGAF